MVNVLAPGRGSDQYDAVRVNRPNDRNDFLRIRLYIAGPADIAVRLVGNLIDDIRIMSV